MIKNYFKTAWRNLTRNKIYSFINIAGLSIGLAVCMLIVLLVKDEFSFDQFQEHKRDIYRLVMNETGNGGELFTYGTTGMVHGDVFKKQIPELQELVRLRGGKVNIKHNNEVLVQDATYTDSNFFSMFSAEIKEGSIAQALAFPHSIVISENVARRFFGDQPALGRRLSIEKNDEFKDYTISAVTKNSPQNSSIQIDLLVPFDDKDKQDKQWINFYLNSFFILKPGSNIAAVERRINQVFAKEAASDLAIAKTEWNYESKLVFGLQPFLNMHLSKKYKAENGLKDSGNAVLSYVLSGLALFILLIACINFVNISISHSVKRAKEIGVRKVMGGGRRQLIGQFMSESFLLNAGALVFAVLLVNLFLPVFNDLTSKSLAFSYLFDLKLVLIFTAVFLFTVVLAGFYPALVLSSYKPVQILYGRFRLSGKNLLLKSLIVFQFALAAFFIILAFIQNSQVKLFTSKDLGYNDRDIVLIHTGGENTQKGKVFMDKIRQNKNITGVAPRNFQSWITTVTVNGDVQLGPDMNVVDENFLSTLGLSLKEGRNFSAAYPADSTLSVMVNEAFVKEAGWKNAIGQNVKVMNRDPYNVVGVVKDYHFSSLYEKVRPQVFTCNNSYGGYSTFYIRLGGNDIPQALNFLKASFNSIFPSKPYSYSFLEDMNDRQYENEMKMRRIIFWSALIVIFISCMGMFGLSLLTAEKRKKEIGVRKVLGASTASLVEILSAGYIKLVLLAFSIAAPLAWYAGTQILQNYPYRINIGFGIFAATLLLLLLISLLTVSSQALRTAVANPVKSLRTE